MDEKASDLIHWQTRLVRAVEGVTQQLRAGAYALVSSGAVTLPDPQLGLKAVLPATPTGVWSATR
jgi:hypothetical protein